ncbi:hypothetical protein ACTHPH_03540 [Paenibacillus pasadenensis]|uniref:hypothetical protein n=1 Tax=Paenibacillus pasadenensis TaxID=217090 RepID=UPI000FD91C4A
MHHFNLSTGLFKPVADELGAIVRSNDGPIRFVKELAPHERFLRDSNQILGFAGQAVITGDHGPVETSANASMIHSLICSSLMRFPSCVQE